MSAPAVEQSRATNETPDRERDSASYRPTTTGGTEPGKPPRHGSHSHPGDATLRSPAFAALSRHEPAGPRRSHASARLHRPHIRPLRHRALPRVQLTQEAGRRWIARQRRESWAGMRGRQHPLRCMAGAPTSGPASLLGVPIRNRDGGRNHEHLGPDAAGRNRVVGPWANSLFVPR